MNIVVLYIYISKPSEPNHPDFDSIHQRFVSTYKKHFPKTDHLLMPVIYRGEKDEKAVQTFSGLNVQFAHYPVSLNGFDIGAFIHVGSTLDCDLVIGLNSQVHFYRDGWLERLAEAHTKHPRAILGPWGSYERSPHIRGPCMAFPPWLIRQYPYRIDSREACYKAESGEWNMTRWATLQGYGTWMVTWNEILSQHEWRKPANCFRRGNQSDCLMWERHSLVWFNASPQDKLNLSRSADGYFNRP